MKYFSFSKTLLVSRFIICKNVSTKKTLYPEKTKLKNVEKTKNKIKVKLKEEDVILQENEISNIDSFVSQLENKINLIENIKNEKPIREVDLKDFNSKQDSLCNKGISQDLLTSYSFNLNNEFDSINVGLKSLIENNFVNDKENIEFEINSKEVIISISKIEKLTIPLDIIYKIQSKFKGEYKDDMIIKLYIDGACKEKIRKGYIGVICYLNHNTLFTLKGNIGSNNTNNVCEYMSLIYGLIMCKLLNINKNLRVFTDSELLEKQFKGEYKLKTPHIVLLNKMLLELSSQFTNFKITHVLREFNRKADNLANQAVFIDEKSLNIKF